MAKKIYLHSETIKAMMIILMMGVIISWTLMFSFTNASTIKINDDYHKTSESEYRYKVISYLEDLGYKNASVTLLRTFSPGEVTEYTLSIHHRLLDKKSDEDIKHLLDCLSMIDFPIDYANINIEYMRF